MPTHEENIKALQQSALSMVLTHAALTGALPDADPEVAPADALRAAMAKYAYAAPARAEETMARFDATFANPVYRGHLNQLVVAVCDVVRKHTAARAKAQA